MRYVRSALLAFSCSLFLAGCGSPGTSTIDTASWTQYQSPSGHLSLRIPPTWQQNTSTEDTMRFTNTESHTSFVVRMEQSRSESLGAYLTTLSALRASIVPGEQTAVPEEQTPIVIDNQDAMLRSEHSPLAGLEVQSAYVVHGGTAYIFTIYNDSGTPPTPEEDTLFHYVLSTVRFPTP